MIRRADGRAFHLRLGQAPLGKEYSTWTLRFRSRTASSFYRTASCVSGVSGVVLRMMPAESGWVHRDECVAHRRGGRAAFVCGKPV